MPKYSNKDRAVDYPYTWIEEFSSRKINKRARTKQRNLARNLKALQCADENTTWGKVTNMTTNKGFV